MSKEIALEDIACCKAEKSNTTNHPITRYNSKEIISNLPVKNVFKKVPSIAIDHTIPNNNTPLLWLKKISV